MFRLGKKQQRLSFNDPRRLIGEKGIVSIPIQPDRTGQIAICGTWYCAICEEPIFLDEDVLVEVINIQGNTVSVLPIVKSF